VRRSCRKADKNEKAVRILLAHEVAAKAEADMRIARYRRALAGMRKE